MPDTPYCPLLSINKDVPVLCQEELCMWYVKQLKLCSITVLAYTNAITMQSPQAGTAAPKPQTSNQEQQQVKPNLTKETTKPQSKAPNPFALDDLD